MTGADEFEAFVRRYQDMVYATAVRLLGNPAEAEDIAQNVFLRAFQRFAEIGQSPAVPGWLKTVTTNACLNHLQRHRARWRLFSELQPGDDAPDFESTLASESSQVLDLERADTKARLEIAVGELPDHQRVPLVLYHLEDMGYQEIAERLGISLAKVKTDIHRARLALRKRLAIDAPR